MVRTRYPPQMGNPGPDPDEEEEIIRRRALRTKPKAEVVDFSAARTAKLEADRARARINRAGEGAVALAVVLDKAPLTPAEQELCQRLYDAGDGLVIHRHEREQFYAIVQRLALEDNRHALTFVAVDLTDYGGGGGSRQADVA
jgi:hypothetical protein